MAIRGDGVDDDVTFAFARDAVAADGDTDADFFSGRREGSWHRRE